MAEGVYMVRKSIELHKYFFSLLLMLLINTVFSNQHISDARPSDQEISKQLNDPLAPIIFMPIVSQHYQWTQGSAVGNTTGTSESARPTFPIFLPNNKLVLLNHAVIPYFNVPNGAAYPDFGNTTLGNTKHIQPGFSNIVGPIQIMSALALNKADGLNAGIGPYLNIPIGKLGGMDQNVGLGAAGIVRYIKDAWVVSAIIQNAWSIGQNGNAPKFSQFMLTPNISYNFTNGWSILTIPFITADLIIPGGNWFVPLGGGVGKVVHFGKLPVQFVAHIYNDVIRTKQDPAWSGRFVVALMLPEKS